MLTESKEPTSVADPWTLSICYEVSCNKGKIPYEAWKVSEFPQSSGGLEDKARFFAGKGKYDNMWAFNSILEFLQMQKERFNRKEITAGTIRNYVKSIKLFCQMADVSVPWEKITIGLRRGRRYSDDRAPTLEEIKKLCEYPDRRIKPLVYTMVSSGIRVGAWDYLDWGNIRPIEQEGKIVAGRMLVYADEDDSYITGSGGNGISGAPISVAVKSGNAAFQPSRRYFKYMS
jgi:hypothetical protein